MPNVWGGCFNFHAWNLSDAHGLRRGLPWDPPPIEWFDRPKKAVSPYADRYHFNNPFALAERCRTIIFWAADWKSYEDAESSPSAPGDRSDMGRTQPNINEGQPYRWQSERMGNPEQHFVWANPERDGTLDRPPKDAIYVAMTPGWGGTGDIIDSRHHGIFYKRGTTSPLYYAQNFPKWSVWWTFGYWGADRNQNGVFDQGPIPATSRMRATEVARFNFYDPVGWTTIRN
jgi:hypothetical protein